MNPVKVHDYERTGIWCFQGMLKKRIHSKARSAIGAYASFARFFRQTADQLSPRRLYQLAAEMQRGVQARLI